MAASKVTEKEGAKGVQKMEVEEVVEHSAEKLWPGFVNSLESKLPVLMPGHFDTFTQVEGPLLTPGSIFTVSYHQDIKHYDYVKFRWDEMNHEEHRFKCTLIEGGGLNKYFTQLAYTFYILPGPKLDSSIMHFIVEYVDIGDHTFHDFIKQELQNFSKSLESYLHDVKE